MVVAVDNDSFMDEDGDDDDNDGSTRLNLIVGAFWTYIGALSNRSANLVNVDERSENVSKSFFFFLALEVDVVIVVKSSSFCVDVVATFFDDDD